MAVAGECKRENHDLCYQKPWCSCECHYKPPNNKGVRHRRNCFHDEVGVTICTCEPIRPEVLPPDAPMSEVMDAVLLHGKVTFVQDDLEVTIDFTQPPEETV